MAIRLDLPNAAKPQPMIDAGAANIRQFGRECPWVRASVGRPAFIGNADIN
jgi:hypothetical protein